MEEIKFIWIGVGKGFAKKLPVFMVRKMNKLDKPKEKKYKMIYY